MIHTLLIANRGEIACRIICTCRALGIRSVAVYSEADAEARHVALADQAIALGGTRAAESYLDGAKLIAAAQRVAADAIHPGYGFLAEDANFARAVQTAGLIFVGPQPAVIAAMGNKRAARQQMAQAGVPVIAGYDGSDQSDAAFLTAAASLGYPLLVKAAGGGGGKGMRHVTRTADLPAALAAARREAKQAFGSDELLIEQALDNVRHVEVQIFGDTHGNLVHLGERDCSVQRRHQKIIEESPAPGLSDGVRAALHTAALTVARTLDYTNAGTVEFLVTNNDQIFFLEVNTRIQVEHPVTEMVSGHDLIAWQIRVAEGAPLPVRQAQIAPRGHAIEVRLYAEDPVNDFLPAAGPIALWQPATTIRVDDGIQSGDDVSIHYDPLLAKLIAHGPDRATALRRLHYALNTSALFGVANNRALLLRILSHPAFVAGGVTTDFIATHAADLADAEQDPTLALIAAALAQFSQSPRDSWRNNSNRPLHFPFHGRPSVALQPVTDWIGGQTVRDFSATLDERTYRVRLNSYADHQMTLTIDGLRQTVTLAEHDGTWWVQTADGVLQLRPQSLLPMPRPPADAGGSLRAPMPGAVTAVLVEVGQRVQRGDALLKLEAMKMEHTIRTASAGVVSAIFYAVGDTVAADTRLIQIEAEDETP